MLHDLHGFTWFSPKIAVLPQARPLLLRALETGDLSELVDPRLGKQYVESQMFRMVEAAAGCVRHSAPKRPRMVQVMMQKLSQAYSVILKIAWNHLGPSSMAESFQCFKNSNFFQLGVCVFRW